MKKKNVSDKKGKKMKKKIEKISANIQETKELITGVEEELDALKEDDDGDSYVNSSNFALISDSY